MTLQEFLNKGKNVKNITKKIVVGDRFKDENGKDMAFTIKALTSEQLEKYRDEASTYAKDKFKFNASKFNIGIAIECCVYPNFKDADSIKEKGLHTPEEYVKAVLLPGEIEAISKEIQTLSGYNISVNELIEEAKN